MSRFNQFPWRRRMLWDVRTGYSKLLIVPAHDDYPELHLLKTSIPAKRFYLRPKKDGYAEYRSEMWRRRFRFGVTEDLTWPWYVRTPFKPGIYSDRKES